MSEETFKDIGRYANIDVNGSMEPIEFNDETVDKMFKIWREWEATHHKAQVITDGLIREYYLKYDPSGRQ